LLALHSNGGLIPLSNDNIEKLISLGFKANHSIDGCNNKAHAGVLTSKKRGALPSKKVNADTNWEEMYMALVAHKDEHKTLHIPHDNSSLSELEKKIKNFIHRQREEYRKLHVDNLRNLLPSDYNACTRSDYNWSQRISLYHGLIV
jgi:hypothetical protein